MILVILGQFQILFNQLSSETKDLDFEEASLIYITFSHKKHSNIVSL